MRAAHSNFVACAEWVGYRGASDSVRPDYNRPSGKLRGSSTHCAGRDQAGSIIVGFTVHYRGAQP